MYIVTGQTAAFQQKKQTDRRKLQYMYWYVVGNKQDLREKKEKKKKKKTESKRQPKKNMGIKRKTCHNRVRVYLVKNIPSTWAKTKR